MKENKFILTGDSRQQASQLLEILKEKELSPEQLEKLVPNVKEFYTQCNDLIKEEINANRECNINTIKALQNTLENLVGQLNVQTTTEEKKQILQVISEIQKSIKEIEINRENKSHGFKKLMAFLGTLVMIVLIIVTGGTKGKKES